MIIYFYTHTDTILTEYEHLLQRLILNLILLLCFVSTATNQFQLDILRPKLATPKKRSGSLRTARRFSKPSPVAKDLFRMGMFFAGFFVWDGMKPLKLHMMRSATWICQIDKYTIQIQLEFLKHDLQENCLGIVGPKGIFVCVT